MNTTRTYAPDWLDDEGAAYILTLPVSTFRQYVAIGILPCAIGIGKHARWSRDALNSSLANIGEKPKGKSPSDKIRELANGQKTEGRDHAA